MRLTPGYLTAVATFYDMFSTHPKGANDVYVCATHALLSGPAKQRLIEAPIEEVIVTDTIHTPEEKRFEKLDRRFGEALVSARRLMVDRSPTSQLPWNARAEVPAELESELIVARI